MQSILISQWHHFKSYPPCYQSLTRSLAHSLSVHSLWLDDPSNLASSSKYLEGSNQLALITNHLKFEVRYIYLFKECLTELSFSLNPFLLSLPLFSHLARSIRTCNFSCFVIDDDDDDDDDQDIEESRRI